MDLIADFQAVHQQLTARERFWLKVDMKDPDECWLFRGAPSQKYGKFTINYVQYCPARFSFYLANGYFATPETLHSCDTPRCVNPRHLREGTYVDNARDMVERNRSLQQHGELNHAARLTNAQVCEIRTQLAAGVMGKLLAAEYGVSRATISEINTGKHWHLTQSHTK